MATYAPGAQAADGRDRRRHTGCLALARLGRRIRVALHSPGLVGAEPGQARLAAGHPEADLRSAAAWHRRTAWVPDTAGVTQRTNIADNADVVTRVKTSPRASPKSVEVEPWRWSRGGEAVE